MSRLKRIDNDPSDLVSRLGATLGVMKQARKNQEPMAIWESDILAIEAAIAALSSDNVGSPPRQSNATPRD